MRLGQTMYNEVDVVMLSRSWMYIPALRARICRIPLFSCRTSVQDTWVLNMESTYLHDQVCYRSFSSLLINVRVRESCQEVQLAGHIPLNMDGGSGREGTLVI